MIDVVDGIRDLFEPPSTLDPELSTNGVAIDRTCAEPFEKIANTVYAWEAACRETSIGTGEVRQDFEVDVLYVVDNLGENAIALRSREVSEALDTKRSAYMKLVRDHANMGFGDRLGAGDMQATSDADFLRQFEVRGIAIRVTGYRLVTGN